MLVLGPTRFASSADGAYQEFVYVILTACSFRCCFHVRRLSLSQVLLPSKPIPSQATPETLLLMKMVVIDAVVICRSVGARGKSPAILEARPVESLHRRSVLVSPYNLRSFLMHVVEF